MKTTRRIVLTLSLFTLLFLVAASVRVGIDGWDVKLKPCSYAARSDGFDLRSLKVLARTVLYIQGNYVDQDKVKPRKMLVAALDKVAWLLPEVVVGPAPGESEEDPAALRVSVGKASTVFDVGKLDTLWALREKLKEILGYIQDHLHDPEVELPKVEYAAINGILSTLDPHSVLLDPDTYREMKVSTHGEFGGLGIVISIRDDELTIISPLEDTPAWRAGLKAQDRIVRIEDESTVNMRLDEAVKRLRGKEGTQITIWVLRKGWSEPKKYTLTRERITIKSVKSKLLEDGVGYVRLKSFQGHSKEQVREHLDRMRTELGQELKGLVLDLRGNPGGLLEQAVEISDLFLESGTIVLTVGKGNAAKERPKEAHWSGTEKRYPMVVLVGPGSASASEIVAAALQNNDRAVVVGKQTFGKGSVQVLYEMDDGSALKLTIAQYLTPGEVSIQGVGIQPDITLEPVTFDEKRVHLYAEERFGEGDLDSALTNDAAPGARAPSIKVRYLEESKEDDEEGTETAEAPPVDEDAVEEDFPIRFAQQLLARTKGVRRPELIKDADALVREQQEMEMGRIADTLAKRSVDWSMGPGPAGAKLDLQLETDHPGARVKAGETIVLRARVRNLGSQPVHRLRAISDCDNPDFKGLEFVFGRVDPGQERVWEVPVEIGKPEQDATDLVEISLHFAESEEPLANARLLVEVDELPRPRFSYGWQLRDEKGGNGDGLLQRGESVRLDLHLVNRGPGVANDVTAALTNLSGEGVYLEEGRHKVETLAVGEATQLSFRFQVKPKHQDDKVKLRIDLLDAVVREGVEEEVSIPVFGEAPAPQPLTGAASAGAEGAELRAGASDQTAPLGRLKPKRTLPVLAKRGEWLKLKLPGDGVAWAQAAELSVKGGRSPRKAEADAAELFEQREAPVVEFSEAARAATVTRKDRVLVSGVVVDEQLVRDLYVFVHYREGKSRKSRKVAFVLNEDPEASPTRLPFSLEVPLQPGSNDITVVARDGDRLTGVGRLQVLRYPEEAAPAAAAKTP